MILSDVLLVLGGLVLLVAGGEVLVRGAVGLAVRLRVTPAVIGLTVVSAGTSFPELVVSVVAAFRGSPDVAIGNVVGSNIFNLALVLGVCAMVVPLPVGSKTARMEWPFLVLATLVTMLFMRTGHLLNRLEGLALLVALVGFTWAVVASARRDVARQEAADREAGTAPATESPGLPRQAILVGAGLVLLLVGGNLIVDGATSLARAVGISERVVGLTVVAMGTSLPELASSLIAALRGRTDVAVGNVIGSSVFNLLGIFGLGSLFRPLVVDPRFLASDLWWMLGFTLVLAPAFIYGRRVRRWYGAGLLALFAVYMTTLF